jgi:hypothetical protein
VTWGTVVVADGATHQWHVSAGRRMHRTSVAMFDKTVRFHFTLRACLAYGVAFAACFLSLETLTGRPHTFPFRTSCCTPLTRLLGGALQVHVCLPVDGGSKGSLDNFDRRSVDPDP